LFMQYKQHVYTISGQRIWWYTQVPCTMYKGARMGGGDWTN
jgi:hypothetical protein